MPIFLLEAAEKVTRFIYALHLDPIITGAGQSPLPEICSGFAFFEPILLKCV